VAGIPDKVDECKDLFRKMMKTFRVIQKIAPKYKTFQTCPGRIERTPQSCLSLDVKREYRVLAAEMLQHVPRGAAGAMMRKFSLCTG